MLEAEGLEDHRERLQDYLNQWREPVLMSMEEQYTLRCSISELRAGKSDDSGVHGSNEHWIRKLIDATIAQRLQAERKLQELRSDQQNP